MASLGKDRIWPCWAQQHPRQPSLALSTAATPPPPHPTVAAVLAAVQALPASHQPSSLPLSQTKRWVLDPGSNPGWQLL